MCSVLNNLVTSLEFKTIHCATTLCHFERTRNGFVATHFIPLSSTAESRASSCCVIEPERFDQNVEPVNRNEERTRKKPSFEPRSGFTMQYVNTRKHELYPSTLYLSLIFGAFSSNFFL